VQNLEFDLQHCKIPEEKFKYHYYGLEMLLGANASGIQKCLNPA
jgi:hypothetical protein